MPAPYDYTNRQADVGVAFDAYRNARMDRAEVQQTDRQDALRKYLPQAMQGDQASLQQVTEIDPETGFKLQQSLKQQSAEELKQRIAQIDVLGPLLSGVKDEAGLQSALTRAQSLGLDPKVLGNVTLQEIPTFLALSPTVKANAMAELDRKVKEANIRQSDASAGASWANAAESRANAQFIRDGKGKIGDANLTEGQSGARGYAERLMAADAIIADPKVAKAGMSGRDAMFSGIPVFGNSMVTPQYQQYDQAKRNFINAQLRRESGAAIGQSEFDNADRQYFPQYGDSKAVLEQKAANRKLAIENMRRSGLMGNTPTPAPAAASSTQSPTGVIKYDAQGNRIP